MRYPTDTYLHDGHIYNLTKTRLLLRNRETFYLPLKDLVWVLKHDSPDPERVAKAKHRYPLFVTRWRGKWVVVDGLHRLERYRQMGVQDIPVKEVTPDILKQTLVHPHSFQAAFLRKQTK